MRTYDIGDKVQHYASDLVHTGTEVLIVREKHSLTDEPHMMLAVDAVRLADGKFQTGSPYYLERGPIHNDSVISVVGGKVCYLYDRVGNPPDELDRPVGSSVALHEGFRYPNFDRLGITQGGQPVAINRTPPADWQTATPVLRYNQTIAFRGKRGGLHYRPTAQTVPLTLLEHLRVVAEFGDDFDDHPNPFEPVSLLVPTTNELVIHRVMRFGSVQTWDLARPAGQAHVRSGMLEKPYVTGDKPQRENALAVVDAKTSPDGTRLYVSWTGWGSHSFRRGCGISVYALDTYALVKHFDFPAGYLAPSRDGLTLAFLKGVGGRLTGETLTVIDLD